MGPSPEERQGAELLRHAAWIRRLAIGLAGDAALADDLVQDTWLAALRRPPSADRPLTPWLAAVLRNAARQAFRSGARRSARQAEARARAPVAGPEELAERLDVERRLTDELARLDEPFRSTLMLRYYEGLEPSEIARRQGLPAGTVRWRVKRGLALLRERLDDRFGEHAQWSALLLSFARPDLRVPEVGTATAVLPGALAMHALTKIGIGAAAVVALAAGLHLAGALPESIWPLGREAPLALAMRPLAPEPEEGPRDAAEPLRAAVSAREAVRPPPTPDPVVAQAPAAICAVEARAVDPFGAPIADARLRLVDEDAPASTDASPTSTRAERDGHLRLELSHARSETSVRLALGARGYAARGFVAVLRAGETTHLGTVELAPGGAVSGFVRDAQGLALAEVEVTIGAANAARSELEELRLHPAEEVVPAARTDSDGAFLLEGVTTGYVRVWARRAGYLGTYSAPVEIRAGQESYGLELVLESLSSTNRIAGVVLDPSNAPVPGAELDYRYSARAGAVMTAGDRLADGRGRFEFLVPQDAELWITASDPEGRFSPDSASGVRTGSGELVLRLARAEPVELVVTDAGGAPVTRYAFEVLSADGRTQSQGQSRGEHEGGSVVLRLPSEPFLLRVDAAGFELAEVGPLEPAGLPRPLRVSLVPVPGLHGRVTHDGVGVAAADVSLQALVPPGLFVAKNGFRTLVESASETVRTDADGRFLLTPRTPGAFVVRAEHAGLAPAVSAVLELGPSLRGPEVELELTPGGAIEGRVVKLDRTDPAGTIVGLTRGDGQDRTLRVGPDGAYRFERLTPGPWSVIECREEIQPGMTVTNTSDRPRGAPEIEWTCDVQAGRTTRYDLVIGDPEACVLDGRLRIDGRAPLAWSAALAEGDDVFEIPDENRLSIGPGGAFRLARSEPGRYRLVLSGGSQEGNERLLFDVVHLEPGAVVWELDLETGTLEIDGVPAWDGEGIPAFVHVWDGPGRVKLLTVLAGDADGHVTLRSIPAGKGRIVRPDLSTLDLDHWPLVTEVEVRSGGSVHARLP